MRGRFTVESAAVLFFFSPMINLSSPPPFFLQEKVEDERSDKEETDDSAEEEEERNGGPKKNGQVLNGHIPHNHNNGHHNKLEWWSHMPGMAKQAPEQRVLVQSPEQEIERERGGRGCERGMVEVSKGLSLPDTHITTQIQACTHTHLHTNSLTLSVSHTCTYLPIHTFYSWHYKFIYTQVSSQACNTGRNTRMIQTLKNMHCSITFILQQKKPEPNVPNPSCGFSLKKYPRESEEGREREREEWGGQCCLLSIFLTCDLCALSIVLPPLCCF